MRRCAAPALLALLAVLVQAPAARAFCFTGEPPGLGALQARIQADPRAALPLIDRALAAHPDPHRAAWLDATAANAYSALELGDQELAAARRGLAVLGTRPDPARLELLIQEANGLEDEGAIARAIDAIGTIRRTLPAGSVAAVCAQGAVGVLEMQIDRIGASTHDVVDAYRASMAPGLEGPRAALAFSLLTIMLRAGDLDAALSLNREEIAYEQAHGQTYLLANAMLARGTILDRQGAFALALPAFAASGRLDQAIGHVQGIAFSQRGICEARLGLGQLAEARAACAEARRLYGAAMERATAQRLALLDGRIAPLRHVDAAALADLAADFGPATSMSAEPAAAALRVRAEAYAGLGRYAEAARDLADYAGAEDSLHARASARQTAIMRAQVDADRAAAAADTLRRQLAADRALNRVQRVGFVLAMAIACLVVVLLSALLLLARRHRRVLTRLAEEDPLTGLPNRRCVARRAGRLLAEARGQEVAVAVLDLDRFKAINDGFGHAAGDAVLQAFAREARAAIGAHGIVGRWGGEEFLVVVPRATAADAAGILTELRQRLEKTTLDAIAGRRVDFSAGVAHGGGMALETLCAAADRALYAAKRAGRGRTHLAEAATMQVAPARATQTAPARATQTVPVLAPVDCDDGSV